MDAYPPDWYQQQLANQQYGSSNVSAGSIGGTLGGLSIIGQLAGYGNTMNPYPQATQPSLLALALSNPLLPARPTTNLEWLDSEINSCRIKLTA